MWKDTDTNTWTYTITNQTDSNIPLERYAPNGMPWQYEVEETVPGNYRAEPSDTVGVAEKEDGSPYYTYTMAPLTNTIQLDKPFFKQWFTSGGTAVKDDYLGYKLQVTFKLQVLESDSGNKDTAKGK